MAGADSEKAIIVLEQKLMDLKTASDWENMTIDDQLELNPTIKREIAQDLENHEWFTV